MKEFYQNVDLRSRRDMTDFLKNHFRYHTMNSWNRSTSYANNIKIYNLGLPSETADKLYNFIDCEWFWDETRELFRDFGSRHNHYWQIGINGRNGGYLVLYRGYTESSGYKSFCRECGQKNYKTVEETQNNICGKCGEPARGNYSKPPMRIGTYPGKSTDINEDFEDFTISSLRERTRLIQEFDRVTDDLIKLALEIIENYSIEDETYYVPKTRKILVTKTKEAI